MLVHFICTGNSFRSRLAESYFKSKETSNHTISTGITAHHNSMGVVSWYTQRLLFRNGLILFDKGHWTQTKQEDIDSSDLIVFMMPMHLKLAQSKFDLDTKKFEIWQIDDLDDLGFRDEQTSIEDDVERIRATEMIFEQIKNKVDNLLERIG